jgi:RNA polymerase sigma-70 factor (ECF subfamily)
MSDVAPSVPALSFSDTLLPSLYRNHFGAVRSYLARRLGCPEAGCEAAQDIFLKLLLRPQTAPIENPRGFLLRSARNLAIDLLRAESVRPAIEPIEDHEDTLVDPVSDPARIAEARQRLRALAEGIGKLPPKCRDVFFLHRFEGLTQREIAGRLDISAKMVEAHLARAMLHLRRHWPI